jgi:hypothetical protein
MRPPIFSRKRIVRSIAAGRMHGPHRTGSVLRAGSQDVFETWNTDDPVADPAVHAA